MRSAALRRSPGDSREIMIKRQQLRQQQQEQMALQPHSDGGGGQDWTEVSIACPPPGTNLAGRKTLKGRRPLIPPGQLLRETLGADVLLLLGALLAFLGSAVTLLATYGRFGNPESRPTVLGLGPPLVGIGFVFCLLRLFFCQTQKIKKRLLRLAAGRSRPSQSWWQPDASQRGHRRGASGGGPWCFVRRDAVQPDLDYYVTVGFLLTLCALPFFLEGGGVCFDLCANLCILDFTHTKSSDKFCESRGKSEISE
ncbi:hypothetical protein MTO96_034865 [Rhipicephalus appendiculatus]